MGRLDIMRTVTIPAARRKGRAGGGQPAVHAPSIYLRHVVVAHRAIDWFKWGLVRKFGVSQISVARNAIEIAMNRGLEDSEIDIPRNFLAIVFPD